MQLQRLSVLFLAISLLAACVEPESTPAAVKAAGAATAVATTHGRETAICFYECWRNW